MDLKIFVQYLFGMNGTAGANARVIVVMDIDNDSTYDSPKIINL